MTIIFLKNHLLEICWKFGISLGKCFSSISPLYSIVEKFPRNLNERLGKILKKKQLNRLKDGLKKMTDKEQIKLVWRKSILI